MKDWYPTPIATPAIVVYPWICSACTLVNGPDQRRCVACGMARPEINASHHDHEWKQSSDDDEGEENQIESTATTDQELKPFESGLSTISDSTPIIGLAHSEASRKRKRTDEKKRRRIST